MFGSLLAPASFAQPEWLPESGWHEHAPFAAWLIEAHRPRTFVELGTHHGYSYAAFCAAIRASGIGTRCAAVDTWRGDVHAGHYADTVFVTFSNFHNPRFAHFSRLLRMTFDEALPQFEDGSIDLLHIDGRHYYEDARHDFESWRPKLSDRAVVLFHDTTERGNGFGVYRLWEEVAAQHPHFEFHHGHGLGVLGIGASQTAAMRELYAASGNPALADAVRKAYAFLGKAITDHRNLRLSIEHLRQALTERDNAVRASRQSAETNLPGIVTPWPTR